MRTLLKLFALVFLTSCSFAQRLSVHSDSLKYRTPSGFVTVHHGPDSLWYRAADGTEVSIIPGGGGSEVTSLPADSITVDDSGFSNIAGSDQQTLDSDIDDEIGVLYDSLAAHRTDLDAGVAYPLNLTDVSSSDIVTGVISYGGDRFVHNYPSTSVMIGENAGMLSGTGNGNSIGIGTEALSNVLSTSGNSVGIGYQASINAKGASTIAIGYRSNGGTSTYSSNPNYYVFIGDRAGYNAFGGGNIGIGQNAAYGTLNSEAVENIAIGTDALKVHNKSGGAAYTGGYNVAIGSTALTANTTGYYNVAVGHKALASATTQTNNTAVGYESLNTNAGFNNVAIGAGASKSNTSGSATVAVGVNSNNLGVSSNSVFVGHNSGRRQISTSYNTAVGQNSLGGILASVTGNGNVAIGANAFAEAGSVSNSVAIGQSAANSISSGTNMIVIGNGATANGSNTATIGNSSVTTIYSHGQYENLDDGEGIILRSPDGTRYLLTIANGGTVSVSAAP